MRACQSTDSAYHRPNQGSPDGASGRHPDSRDGVSTNERGYGTYAAHLYCRGSADNRRSSCYYPCDRSARLPPDPTSPYESYAGTSDDATGHIVSHAFADLVALLLRLLGLLGLLGLLRLPTATSTAASTTPAPTAAPIATRARAFRVHELPMSF